MFPPHGSHDIHPWEHGAETGVSNHNQTGVGAESQDLS